MSLLQTFAFVCLALISVQCADSYTCIGPGGQEMRVGAAWVADDGCNVCQCYPTEVHCTTWRDCSDGNMLGQPGDPLCAYALSDAYTVGQTWTTMDGCNHCVCTVHGMNCTYQPCPGQGFATPKPPNSPAELGDCPYEEHRYRPYDHFLATDQCNTCICSLPGNFATFPACTTTDCDIFT